MTEPTITAESIANILRRGERTGKTRLTTGAFLKQIADVLIQEAPSLDADVGVRAYSDSRKIQYIDRAFFYFLPEHRAPISLS